MKTPRDILMERHQTAAPKLDGIRRGIVAEFNNKETKEQSRPSSLVALLLCCFNKFWLELIWPCRRIWTGLATIWILIFAINYAQRDGSQNINVKSAPTVGVMMAFGEQEKMLNELLADRSLSSEADRPRNAAPKPRSETAEITAV
ncbi:MAG TPA: hypothetical protein VIK53_06880 [Verrucomicrobiae bacterium]